MCADAPRGISECSGKAAVSADGRRVLCYDGYNVGVLDLATGVALLEMMSDRDPAAPTLHCVEVVNGVPKVLSYDGAEVSVMDDASEEVERRAVLRCGRAESLVLCPDGVSGLCNGGAGMLRVWDVAGG